MSAPAIDVARCNVADRLALVTSMMPTACAVAAAIKRGYATCTFAELDADATALARGLVDLGVRPGMRLVLLVPPGVEFVKLVFALLRSGATAVLVDPGMGRRRLIDCLAGAAPDGFIAVPRAQAVRMLLRRRFPDARFNVTLGRRLFWRGPTYTQLLAPHPPVSRDPKSAQGSASPVDATTLPVTHPNDPAAIIFTSGSTGPPKGVLYTHRMFDTQAAEIQRAYDIQPGGVDLACFAFFGLFNSAWGVTTVFPDMNFSRPASADPQKLLAAANDWKVTQAFASPAVWDKLSRHCEQSGDSIPTLRKVFSCGAPVSPAILRRTLDHVASEGAQMYTPYGATEALPVSTIEAAEVLGETEEATRQGAGICVGRKFDSIEWRVIQITDGPIANINDAAELPAGEIGELIVRGPQVSKSYLDSETANAAAKITDGTSTWHRLGDVGYFDDQHRFWYCGRKSHRVETAAGPLYTECVEAIFNQHPAVRRSALVGMPCAGLQMPVMVVELNLEADKSPSAWTRTAAELRDLAAQHEHTRSIVCFLNFRAALPVDVRHNAKINREALAAWAAKQLTNASLRHVTKLYAQGAPRAPSPASSLQPPA